MSRPDSCFVLLVSLLALQDEQQRPAVPDLGGGDASVSGSSGGSGGRQANVKCARCYSLVHYG